MPGWLRIIFAIVAMGVVLGVHHYLWRRLVRDTRLPHPWRRVATIAIGALALSFPLTMAASRLIGGHVGVLFGWPIFLWFGLAVLLMLGFAFVDSIRLARWSVRRGIARVRRGAATNGSDDGDGDGQADPDFDPDRRKLFARAAGGAVVTAALGTSVVGAYEALRDQDIEEVPVTLKRLPPAMDGFSIVQLSDIHVGFTVSRAYLQNIVDRANALKPDLIAITGDLVDGDVESLRDAVAPLAQLSAPHGVYFITGNHEYYSGPDEWMAEITRLGIRVLFNERVSIGEGAVSFDLAGVTDIQGAQHGKGHAPDLKRALAGRDSSRELVLLAHQPLFVYQTEGHGVGLQLSGHTHGGQIWPWHYLVKLQQRGFLAGLQRHGDTQVYTSRGTGYWGPPLRVGARSEITRLILRPPGSDSGALS